MPTEQEKSILDLAQEQATAASESAQSAEKYKVDADKVSLLVSNFAKSLVEFRTDNTEQAKPLTKESLFMIT